MVGALSTAFKLSKSLVTAAGSGGKALVMSPSI